MKLEVQRIILTFTPRNALHVHKWPGGGYSPHTLEARVSASMSIHRSWTVFHIAALTSASDVPLIRHLVRLAATSMHSAVA